ncbi:hypothetical protein V1509DRAFT_449690 [Lipomyces kononenkoae]
MDMPSDQLSRLFNFLSALPRRVLTRAADEEHHMLELVPCADLNDEGLDDDDLDYVDTFDDLYDNRISMRCGDVRSRENQLFQTAYAHTSCVNEERYAKNLAAVSLPSRGLYFQNVHNSGQVRLYTPERYPQYLWHYYTPIRQRHRSSFFGGYCHIYQWPRVKELTCPKRRKCEAKIMRKSPIDRTILQPITEINVPTDLDKLSQG